VAAIKQLKLTDGAFIILFALFASAAQAREYRIGASMGFGGTGIAKVVKVNGTSNAIERSEGPGVLSIFAETFYSDKIGLGVEHSRGFRLGPFTSGLTFTGLYGRYYFFGPAPQAINSEGTESTILYKRYAMFLGLSGGVGQGKVSRNADQVPNLSGSGVYMGIRLGADYPLGDRWGIRPELIYNTTFMESEVGAPSLTEFALQAAFYWSI
jgi:hypothetical protein